MIGNMPTENNYYMCTGKHRSIAFEGLFGRFIATCYKTQVCLPNQRV